MGYEVAIVSSLLAFSLQLSPSRPHCDRDEELSVTCPLLSKAGFLSCSLITLVLSFEVLIIICNCLFTCVCLLISYLPPSLNCKLSEGFSPTPSIVLIFPAPSTVSGTLETPNECLLSEC